MSFSPTLASRRGTKGYLQCHGERIYVLDLTVLTEDKRLVVTAVLLHYLSVGLFEPSTQFRL